MPKPRKNLPTKKKKLILNDKQVKPAKENKILRYLKKGWVIVGVISVLAAIFGLPVVLKENRKLFSSEHELYIDEHFIKGILIPNYNSDDSAIRIGYGGLNFEYLIKDLKAGVEFSNDLLTCQCAAKQVPFKMRFLLQNSRLYVSSSFKDLAKGEVIGIMAYNKWSLFKENQFDWYSDDTTLEVMDKQGYIVFQLSVKNPGTIDFKGYSVFDNCVAIISDGFICLPKSAAQTIIDQLGKIHPLHLSQHP